jgi:hypothetical protein
MVATFLRTDDGGFDYSAALVSLFALLAVASVLFFLFRAIKSGRIVSPWGYTYSGAGHFYVERTKNPIRFWFVIVVYLVGMLFFITVIASLCFGLLGSHVDL